MSSASSLGRAALPLILSDVALQGARYAFILYLGAQSLSYLGSFLMGGALGSLLGVLTDFGISQHWLRMGVKDARLSCRTFTGVLFGKIICSLLGIFLLGLLVIGGVWNVATPLAMGIGVLLMTLQALGEACEAVGLLFHRYMIVALFRLLQGLGIYVLPIVCGALLDQSPDGGGSMVTLLAAAACGMVLSSLYIWKVAGALHRQGNREVGYGEAWWGARWLGVNQVAVVIDVRAPLIILGFMLGETAVGLYGLVQRTTAVVELAWASISRLLLTSYSELVGEQGVQKMRAKVIHAGKVTAMVMAVAGMGVWCSAFVLVRITEWSGDIVLAISLLQWAVVAIGFSSVKRPFVSGLIALFQERLVCRVNVIAALFGLLLVPLCIRYWGIWGPVMAWIVLEVAACLVLVLLFFYVSRQVRSALVTSTSGGMDGYTK